MTQWPGRAVPTGRNTVQDDPRAINHWERQWAGGTWLVGKHRLICGDCRDRDVVHRLSDGTRANLVITSPPYATQREYDPESGFTPVPPEEYVG